SRLACGNNLKQIGLAALHYEMHVGALPPSRNLALAGPGQPDPDELNELLNPNDDEPDGDEQMGGPTWAVYLLPYLDEANLFERGTLQGLYSQQAPPARQTPVPTYFCPSRRGPTTSPVLSLSGDETLAPDGSKVHYPGALGDYACCVGPSGSDHYSQAAPT